MTDFGNLPWDELALPEFRGKVSYVRTCYTGGFEWTEIYYDTGCQLAHQIYHQPERWKIPFAWRSDEIEQIAKMCRLVEEFIERHGWKDD